MKKVILVLSVNLLIAIYSFGQSKQSHSTSSVSISDDKDGDNTMFTIYSDDEHSLEIKQSGSFRISDDEMSFASLGDKSSISYKKDGERIKIQKNEDGIITYKFNGGVAKSILNIEEQKFLSIVIKDLIAHGFGAEDRAERLYKNGGIKSVLNAVELVKGDYAKSIYLAFLLKKVGLTKSETTEILKEIANSLSSDYEKAKLLKRVDLKLLQDAEAAQIFYTTLKGVNSDYEKSNVIQSIVKNASSSNQLSEALGFMNEISSDYEKSNVLKSIISHQMSDGANFDKLLTSIDVINSDYEKAGIFKRLIKHKSLSETQWIDLFKVIKKVDSDYEKANVLQRAVEKMPNSDQVRKAFSDCAKTIDSDHEYGRLMKTIQ